MWTHPVEKHRVDMDRMDLGLLQDLGLLPDLDLLPDLGLFQDSWLRPDW